MQPRLVAVFGPLKGSVVLVSAELTVGRHPSNEVYLEDELVSRRHCSVVFQGGRICIRDLQSRNGTFVNGTAVSDKSLEHGDRIRIGHTQFLYLEHEDSLENAPAFDREGDDCLATMLTQRVSPDELLYGPTDNLAQTVAARRARDLSTLLRVSSSINAIRNPEQLQHRLLEVLLEVLPARRAAILLVGHRRDVFISGTYRNRAGGEQPFRISHSITHRVLSEGEALMSSDVLADGASSSTTSLIPDEVRSVICVPLQVFDARLGVIYADSGIVRDCFDKDHLRLINAIAGIAAVSLEHARYVEWLEGENLRLKEEIKIDHDMIGKSPRMQGVYQFVQKVAASDSTVLILGESGTGKELVARAIHNGSRRSNGPFVAINCGAIVGTLLESELFGHEKGAFTGATTQRKGKIEFADHGTLFLDEIAELAPTLQAVLLRVLQHREFERVGGNRTIQVNVRIIAATNCNLEEAIKDGRFRQDLYYRLKVVSIEMPPLSQRREDIVLLAAHFVQKYSQKTTRSVLGITPEAYRLLSNYDWPGNVRELENTIERAVVLGTSEYIRPEDLPESLTEKRPTKEAGASTYHSQLNETKRAVIRRAFQQAGGSYTDAARLLDLHPNYLHRLIRNLEMKAELKDE